MRLRNKKTGEIGELQITEKHCAVVVGNGTANCNVKLYCTLDKLNEEWEDAPEEAIQVHIEGIQNVYMGGGRVYIDYASAQEAEKAVRKLKAWKRLEDKGFRPKMWEWEYIYDDNISGELIIKAHIDDATDSDGKYTKDLDLLFGGEE